MLKEKIRKKEIYYGDVTEKSDYKTKVTSVFQGIFNRGKSERIINEEKNIKIEKITNKPVHYLKASAFFEKRYLNECKVGSRLVATSTDKKHYPHEYNRWEIECPKCKCQFCDETNVFDIAESKFIEECSACNTKGEVSCYHCYDGTETCYSCNGSGYFRCGQCGGSGMVHCTRCYGSGYTYSKRVVGYDDDGCAIYGDVKETCYGCGGRGDVTCNGCGGSGDLRCNTCSGRGKITCRRCNGTRRITCLSCNGNGYFLHSVQMRQEFGNDIEYLMIRDYDVDTTLFNNQRIMKAYHSL